MSFEPRLRLDVPTRELLEELAASPRLERLRVTPGERSFFREVYFDTPDGSLQQRGVTCRIRFTMDDRREPSVSVRPAASSSGGWFEAVVPEADAAAILAGASEPARRLRAFVDPARLQPVADLEVERRVCLVRSRWLRRPQVELIFDAINVSFQGLAGTFQEILLRPLRAGHLRLRALASMLERRYGLVPVAVDRLQRAQEVLRALESEALVREVQAGREIAVIALEQDHIALRCEAGTLRLPVESGSGEEACRHLMRRCLGSAEGQVRLLGTVAAAGTRPVLEVWLARKLHRGLRCADGADLEWLPLPEVVARVGSPALRDSRTLAALTVAARTDFLPDWPAALRAAPPARSRPRAGPPDYRALAGLRAPVLPGPTLNPDQPAPEHFINGRLSTVEFNARVLGLAEDADTPLLEQLRFLSIVSANLDEFFMIRVGELKAQIAGGVMRPSEDGLTPAEQLDALAIRIRALLARQYQRLHHHVLPALQEHGVRIRRWSDLDPERRHALREFFQEQVSPLLTPHALTQAPGHPFPRIPSLVLSLAVMVRDSETGLTHLTHLQVPATLPRFVPLAGGHEFVPLEDVVSANLPRVYPGWAVEGAYLFRVTRAGELHVDELGTANLLQAIEEEVRRRPSAPAVRIEVEQAMPVPVRNLLLRELRFENGNQVSTLGAGDVYQVDGLLDLRALAQVADLPLAQLRYPPFPARTPLEPNRSIFAILSERDVLVHHPYDGFDVTVERFFQEAADDPEVQTIKLTLYRTGGRSAIVDALLRAAAAGKEVTVFVELKARFDEERNIEWVRKLHAGGIHGVHGFVELKNHAKIALVTRREDGTIRRYVHIGTGNYNGSTARLYTDLGLLSSDAALGADLNDLFNELTGSIEPPRARYRRVLVAPTNMRQRFLELIDREAEHARTGRPARIRAKLNGLADREIIAALYRASQAGVAIDLIIRGICCLRPGVPGLSERIRVVSVLGRFLEHARIYAFENGGEREYYIGSADWRPRNLRRRIEVVAPILAASCQERLERILDAELANPGAWELEPDGSYRRRSPGLPVEPGRVPARRRALQWTVLNGGVPAGTQGRQDAHHQSCRLLVPGREASAERPLLAPAGSLAAFAARDLSSQRVGTSSSGGRLDNTPTPV